MFIAGKLFHKAGEGSGGGGEEHNLGWYATESELTTAYPTAEAGDYAIVGSTDTVWVWDTDNSEWVDTGTKGLVQSVNGQTGTVVLSAADVGALPISGGTVSGPVTLSDTASETKTMLTVGCGPDSSKYFKVVPSHQWSQVDMGIGNSLSLTITGGGLMPNVDNHNVDLGSQFYPFKNVYAELVETGVIKNGGRIIVPQYIPGTMAVQLSSVPAADESYVGQIYQYVGTTDANYTNGYYYKCVSDGGNPATYSWTRVDVQPSSVSSVNGETGAVVLDAEDVGAIPQVSTMPTATATNVGNIVQYVGTTSENYTNGYFYENQPEYSNPSATISQTTGSGLSNLAVDVDTFKTQFNESGNYNFTANVVNTEIFYENVNDWEIEITNPTGILEAFAQSGQTISSFYSGWINYDSDAGEFVCAIVQVQGEPVYQIVINNFVNVITQGTTTGVATITNITFASRSWQYNNQDVNLNTYGITYSGSEVDGDVLTVNYTAPAIVGYNWEQKNIQPASKGGGIDWKTSIDLLENQNGYPIFTIPGGLEDGVYDFYYQVKIADPNLNYPQYFVTYKITFKLSNGNKVRANISYVIDGDFNTAHQKIAANTFGSYWYWVDNDIKMMFAVDRFTTNIRDYGITTEIKDCYKISAIKNVETGEEYIATGETGQQPSGGSTINVSYQFCNLQEQPDIPRLYGSTQFYFSNHKYISLERYLTKSTNPTTDTSKIYFSLFAAGKGAFSGTIDMRAGEYVATIHKATGVFENTTLLKSDSDSIWIQVNAPVGETGMFYGQLSGISASSFYFYGWESVDFQTTPLDINEVGGNITETNFGEILQYTGATDANYTNGYFYKATGTPAVIPAELDAQNIQISGASVNDVVININTANLISAFETYTGWSEETIKYNLIHFTNWVVYYDWDTDTVSSVYWNVWGDISDSPDILSCFTVTTTGSYSGQTPVVFTGIFEDEHIEIQNQSWQRVDVQPSSGGGAISDTGTLSSANWSSNTQTINVTGVTASNNVIVAPAPASQSDYTAAGIICSAQGAGTLTFTCQTTPSSNLTVNVLII